jgi:hypothetical protein
MDANHGDNLPTFKTISTVLLPTIGSNPLAMQL